MSDAQFNVQCFLHSAANILRGPIMHQRHEQAKNDRGPIEHDLVVILQDTGSTRRCGGCAFLPRTRTLKCDTIRATTLPTTSIATHPHLALQTSTTTPDTLGWLRGALLLTSHVPLDITTFEKRAKANSTAAGVQPVSDIPPIRHPRHHGGEEQTPVKGHTIDTRTHLFLVASSRSGQGWVCLNAEDGGCHGEPATRNTRVKQV